MSRHLNTRVVYCTNLFQNEHFLQIIISLKSSTVVMLYTYAYCLVLGWLSNCSGSEGNEPRWMVEGLDPHSSRTVYLFMHLSPPSIHLNKCFLFLRCQTWRVSRAHRHLEWLLNWLNHQVFQVVSTQYVCRSRIQSFSMLKVKCVISVLLEAGSRRKCKIIHFQTGFLNTLNQQTHPQPKTWFSKCHSFNTFLKKTYTIFSILKLDEIFATNHV